MDRHNIGTVIGLDDANGQVLVAFVSAKGATAERTLPWQQVQILDKDTPERESDGRRRTALETAVAAMRRQTSDWYQPPRCSRRRARRRARLPIRRATSASIAPPPSSRPTEPDWLVGLIGARPAKAMPVAGLGRRRTRHRRAPAPVATDPALDLDPTLSTQLAAARVWLADYSDAPAVPPCHPAITASWSRAAGELDAIFDSAPADYRELIAELRDGGQLSFDDTTQLLADALAAQDARTRWILAHWPHVVEYAETTRALDLEYATPRVERSRGRGHLTT